MQASAQGDSSWRKIFSERAGDGSLRWCGCQFPTESDAQEASMSLREYEDFVYGACLLDQADPVAEWKRISKEQEKWVEYLNSKREFRVVSQDTDIRIEASGRKWINCDGECNFPDGEVFTAPVESGINGHIAFQFPGIYMQREIEGIRLEVRDGKVIKATADKGEELLHSILSTDAGSSRFGEFAIGTNRGIRKFTRNMLFDEKIAGTIHLALGDADKEALGTNESSIHWDLLCDMNEDSKIYADGQLFYENGEFKEEVLR
jgi:aminopeptidase